MIITSTSTALRWDCTTYYDQILSFLRYLIHVFVAFPTESLGLLPVELPNLLRFTIDTPPFSHMAPIWHSRGVNAESYTNFTSFNKQKVESYSPAIATAWATRKWQALFYANLAVLSGLVQLWTVGAAVRWQFVVTVLGAFPAIRPNSKHFNASWKTPNLINYQQADEPNVFCLRGLLCYEWFYVPN